MNRQVLLATLLAAAFAAGSAGAAETSKPEGLKATIKEGAKEVGTDIKEGAKEVGADIRDGTKEIRADIKVGATEAGKAIAEGAKVVGKTTAQEARKVKAAVISDKDKDDKNK